MRAMATSMCGLAKLLKSLTLAHRHQMANLGRNTSKTLKNKDNLPSVCEGM